MYAGLDEFVSACAGFVRAGIEHDEPVLLVVLPTTRRTGSSCSIPARTNPAQAETNSSRPAYIRASCLKAAPAAGSRRVSVTPKPQPPFPNLMKEAAHPSTHLLPESMET